MLIADNIPIVSESMFALGNVESFARYGDYALFIGGEKQLQVLDFSDEEHPRLVSGCDVPGQSGSARSISINGQYAYLFFDDCVAIIFINNPLSPQFMARMELGYIISQSIHDDILYIAGNDWSYCLKAYSLNNPIAPQLLDSLLVNNYPSGIACSDGLLVCGNSTVEIVNTSDPANLQISDELNFISGFEYIGSAAFAFNGSTLAVACGYYFSLYDFSQEPYLRATLPLGFQVNGNDGFIHNNRFWCRDNDGSGIFGVDFSITDALEICYTEMFPGMWSFCMDEGLMTLRLNQNNHIMKYCFLGEDNLPDFDHFYPLESICGIVSQGNWTVGINSEHYLQILGFDNAENAYPLYNIGLTGYDDLAIHNDALLYTIGGEPYEYGLPTRYLVVFDMQSKTQKAELALGCSDWGGEITIAGDKAYICNGDYGLFVVDISDVEQPVLLSHLQENIEYQCAVADSVKLWVGSDRTIRCYDISESITPVFCYEIPLYVQTPLIRPYRMLMMDNYLYAISTNGYLARITPGYNEAEEINIYQTRYSIPTSLCKLGAGLLIGSCDGLSVMNVQDSENLKEVAYLDIERVVVGNTGFIVTSYAVNGDRIYVGRGISLQVLDASLAKAFTYVYTPEAEQKLSIYPNPGKGNVKVICKLPASGTTELELYNMRGQKVHSKTFFSLSEGYNLLKMDTQDMNGLKLSSGMYFVRIKQGNHSQTGKLVIVK